jgi:hypothetical protein
MNSFEITYADGNTTITGMNATLAEATKYYVGTSFNFGDTQEQPKDKMVKAISVEQIIDGLFIKQKNLLSIFDIFDKNGIWLNTYRDMIDVEEFCKQHHIALLNGEL